MAIKDGLLSEYDHEMATTRRLLERVPDDKLAWKPHAKSKSLGELASHVSNLPLWGLTILNDASFDLAEPLPGASEHHSRQDLVAAFDRAAANTRATLNRTDPEFIAPWTLKRDGHEMFTLPRIAALRSFVLSHMIHHRGQLSVYLRLNDIPLPPIYGPTADEG
jgi:uncharacterized damage-inducible protein DinB